jgi:hypothetical protein
MVARCYGARPDPVCGGGRSGLANDQFIDAEIRVGSFGEVAPTVCPQFGNDPPVLILAGCAAMGPEVDIMAGPRPWGWVTMAWPDGWCLR